MKRQLMLQVAGVIGALLAMDQAASAASIATVTDVVNEGYRTPPGGTETNAQVKDELVPDEALRTAEESAIQVQFVDGSELTVEQSSEIVLNDYVYSNGASSGTLNLNDGLFHFTSNGNNDQGVKLRTPVATIGVRGTEFLVHVDGDSATIIDILSGAVEATPHGTGKPITCYEGQSILIATENDDALCGDIGSFSTAAGPGADSDSEGGGEGGNGDKDLGPKPERPEPEPDEPNEEGEGSGGCDGNCGESSSVMLIDEDPFIFG